VAQVFCFFGGRAAEARHLRAAAAMSVASTRPVTPFSGPFAGSGLLREISYSTTNSEAYPRKDEPPRPIKAIQDLDPVRDRFTTTKMRDQPPHYLDGCRPAAPVTRSRDKSRSTVPLGGRKSSEVRSVTHEAFSCPASRLNTGQSRGTEKPFMSAREEAAKLISMYSGSQVLGAPGVRRPETPKTSYTDYYEEDRLAVDRHGLRTAASVRSDKTAESTAARVFGTGCDHDFRQQMIRKVMDERGAVRSSASIAASICSSASTRSGSSIAESASARGSHRGSAAGPARQPVLQFKPPSRGSPSPAGTPRAPGSAASSRSSKAGSAKAASDCSCSDRPSKPGSARGSARSGSSRQSRGSSVRSARGTGDRGGDPSRAKARRVHSAR